jgi:hydroxypyruvate reductase
MDLPGLHRDAREIFHQALRSVDAGEAVRRAVRLENTRLKLVETTLEQPSQGRGIYAVAIGKAALPMAAALGEILGERLTAGVLAAPGAEPSQQTSLSDCWRVFEGGHPLPNRASLEAGLAALALLDQAEQSRAPVVFLISGGGSALMEWPRSDETTLDELREAHRALVSCGASIAEINSVRRALSAVKGGGLSRRAPHCDQVTLIISDTNPGEEAIVASGPTFETTTDAAAPSRVVDRYHLRETLPESVLSAIRRAHEKAYEPQGSGLRDHYVLLENSDALASAEGAARRLGYAVEIAYEVVEQPVAEGCPLLLSKLLDLSRRARGDGRGVCLISGGEFACPVRGRGVGGRNGETALRWAIELGALSKAGHEFPRAVALSAGTDGVDGNSPAAGAVCDETTTGRARRLALDPGRFLEESDAHTFFQALGDAIITGPTGTNVRDLRIMLAG